MQQPHPDPRDDAERLPGQLADLRLHALDEPGQVGVGAGPEVVDLLADDRPTPNALSRGRDVQGVLLHGTDEVVKRAAERVQEHRGRRDDEDASADDDQGRGQALAPPHPPSEPSMQGIEGDGQDDRPDHQGQEGREDDVAQRGQDGDEPRPDQDVGQTGPLGQ